MLEKRKSIKNLTTSFINFAISMRGAYGITMTLLTVFLLSSLLILADGCDLLHGGCTFKPPFETQSIRLLEKTASHATVPLFPALNTPLVLRKDYFLHALPL